MTERFVTNVTLALAGVELVAHACIMLARASSSCTQEIVGTSVTLALAGIVGTSVTLALAGEICHERDARASRGNRHGDEKNTFDGECVSN